jgi:C-terminal processing protease CtpA/Prc
VTAVLEGYPAFNATIYRGDVIEAADGESFHPINSFAARAGDTINLTIRRGDTLLTAAVQPVLENLYDSYRTATSNSVQEFSAGNKVVGYLRPWALSKNTADLISFEKLLEQLSHCDALIFDLRNAYGFVDQIHIDSLMGNDNGIDYFEKTVVVLFNKETAAGPMTLVKSVMHLQRIDTLAMETHFDVAPEMTIAYPKTQTSRYDPQYDAALNRLLGII